MNLPTSTSPEQPCSNLPSSPPAQSPGGEMHGRVRNFDWSTTPLGPMDRWPQSLHTAVQTALHCGFPMLVLWGPQLVQIYNDGYRDLMGMKHPAGLGLPTHDCWPEVRHLTEPIFARVWRGEAVTLKDALFQLARHGRLEDAFFTLCYSPLCDEARAIAGVLVTVFETTAGLKAAAEREAALRQAEERVRLATDAAELGIWEWDIATDRVVWQNHKPYELFGLPPSAPMVNASRFGADFVYPDDAAAFTQAVVASAQTGAPFFFEGRMRRNDGLLRWVTFTGRPQPVSPGGSLRVLGTAADITTRKQAELALREAEERYQTLLNSIEQGFCRFEMLYDEHGTPSDYRFLEVNQTFERHTGLRDPVGKTARELVPNLEPHWFAIYGQVATTGEAQRFEQGSVAMGRMFEVEAVRVGAAERREVALVFTDVTDRKRAEAQLAAAAARDQFRIRLADALRLLSDAVAIKGEATRVLGEQLGANRAVYFEVESVDYVVERDYVAGVSAIVGRFPIAAFGPQLLAAYQAGRTVVAPDVEADADLSPAERAAFMAIQIRAHVGVPLVKGGRLVAGLGVHAATPRAWTPDEVALIEETAERTWAAVERARAEAALRESEAQFRLMADAVPQMVWLTDAGGRAEFFNKQWSAYTGAAFEPLTANEVALRFVHPDDIAWTTQAFDEARRTGSVFSVEHRIRSTAGEYRWFLVRAEPYRDPHTGAIVRWFGASVDIHDRKQAEARLERLYEEEQTARTEAEVANRLKDDFLATLSHELRTPLTAILGYGHLLQSRPRDEAYVARAVETIMRSAKVQAQMIDDLLDVSRIVSGKVRIEPQPVALVAVINAALDTLRPAIEVKGLDLEVELDPATNGVLGDANRLQQVVWNLLANAAKFTPGGGRITVRLARIGNYAELQVRDTGQGINAAFLPYVFDRFRQADSSSQRTHGGLGLGLAIVRHLVELHGGTVEARSGGAGQGAAFIVRLPLARASEPVAEVDAALAGEAESDEGPLPLQGLRVLVVEDQAPIRELLAEMLASEGAVVQTSDTARGALALLHQWRPDVLVSDIAMPDEDGYWLIEQVRRLTSKGGGATPAVALTAYVRTEDRLRVLAAGFQHYVPKPVDADELRDVIRRLAATQRAP